MLFHRPLLAAAVLAIPMAQASAAGFYTAKTTTATYLSASGNVWSEVTALTVPAGTWIVNSLSPAVNFNGTDILRCELTVDGVQVNQSSAMMGGGGGMPAAVPVPNLAVVATPYAQTIALSCGHDANVASQRIDPGAELVISRAPKK